jgi:hypothetical protein
MHLDGERRLRRRRRMILELVSAEPRLELRQLVGLSPTRGT